MIDKIGKSHVIQRIGKLTKTHSSKAAKQAPCTVDIYDKIYHELGQGQYDNINALNTALVSKVLSYAFGEKASQEPKFKELFSKVEQALAQDENAQILLEKLKKKLL